MSTLSSGDTGYCDYENRAIGIVITWEDNKVVAVDCCHSICGHADYCKLYNRYPVGFIQDFPISRTSVNPGTLGS